jgi:hypothetical protein
MEFNERSQEPEFRSQEAAFWSRDGENVTCFQVICKQ